MPLSTIGLLKNVTVIYQLPTPFETILPDLELNETEQRKSRLSSCTPGLHALLIVQSFFPTTSFILIKTTEINYYPHYDVTTPELQISTTIKISHDSHSSIIPRPNSNNQPPNLTKHPWNRSQPNSSEDADAPHPDCKKRNRSTAQHITLPPAGTPWWPAEPLEVPRIFITLPKTTVR